MEQELIARLRTTFGPAPRQLTKGQIGGLCLALPKGEDPNSSFSLMFRGQETVCVEGMATLAWSMKAYYPIYAPGDEDCLGMVLFSDCADPEILLKEVPLVVERIGGLRGTTDPEWSEEERKFMAAYDDDYKRCGGLPVPARFSPVVRCYLTDFYFHRNWLPAGCLRSGCLPVLASVSPRPHAIPVPLRYWTETFVKAWAGEIQVEIQAYAQAVGRGRLTARMRTHYLAAPEVQPDPSVPVEALYGSWIHEDEVERFDRAPDFCTNHIWNCWRFEKGGTLEMTMEVRPLKNGEPDKAVPPRIATYLGKFEIEDGAVHVAFKGFTHLPTTLLVLGPNEMAISQTERLHGPFEGKVGSGDEFGHFSNAGAIPEMRGTSPSGNGSATPEKEWIEIVFNQKAVPPGYGYAIGAALMPRLAEKGLGRVLSNVNSAGSRSVMLQTSAEQIAAAVLLAKQVLAEYDAPKDTKIIGQDGEPLAVMEAMPPPLPKPTPPANSKLALVSFLLGCVAVFGGLKAFLAPVIPGALIVGFLALRRIRAGTAALKGRRLAQYGILLAVVGGIWVTLRIAASAWSAIAVLKQASAQLEHEPGYTAAVAAERATRWPEEGASANTDLARVAAEDIVTALLAMQREMLGGTQSSRVMSERVPAVNVHAVSGKVAVTLSFRVGNVKWRAGAENAFYEAAWIVVHRVVSHAALAPEGSDLALGIHTYGHYQAMFFGRTGPRLKLNAPTPVPPHEREIHQGFLLNNEKRFYKYFVTESAQ